jgi:tetratricopeptide (TPR) repeat protein
MGNSPSFSQPRPPSNQGRPQSGGMGAENRPQFNNAQTGTRNPGGPNPGTMNRGQAGNASNVNRSNASNAGAAAAGAGVANRNQPSYPNAGAAAAGAGYANRNQPNYPNAGAAAAGAGYANRNRYNQYHPGMVNGYWNGNNTAAWGLAGAGVAAVSGVGAWGTGSPMYSWGYSGYSNPYSGSGGGSQPAAPQQAVDTSQQPAAPAYNYSEPISTTAAPPEQSVTDQATAAFDQARGAFKAGAYDQALQSVQQALGLMPNDTTLHEFLALVLFAQGQYDQAAAPLYAVLSVGPGWDWTTLSGMYPDVDTYTKQLRALEAYLRANPQSAQGHFGLAYQYLCQGHVEDAVAQLKKVVEIQPGDTLSAQLIAQLRPSDATQPAPGAGAPAIAPAVAGKLVGNWAAAPAKDTKIALAIQEDGRFTWSATNPGKPPMSIAGNSTFSQGTLTLTDQNSQNGALVGQVAWQDDNHFTFRLPGAPQDDPGLKFAR